MGTTSSNTSNQHHGRQVVRVRRPHPSSNPQHQQPSLIRAQAEERNEEKFDDFNYSSGSQSTSRHVGLENRAGENNCFLNATIQALWHLNLFREKVLYSDHTGGDDNIDLIFSTENESADTDTLAALCSLFSQYQFTEEMCIPSTEIRCKYDVCKPT